MVCINDFFCFGDTQVALGILSSCVACQPSYFTRIIFPSLSFLSILVGFDKRIMQVCGDNIGLGWWESL